MRSILLIPNDDHRDALLAPGLCGGTVPIAYPYFKDGESISSWLPHPVVKHGQVLRVGDAALVLAWKGQPAPLGIFRMGGAGYSHEHRAVCTLLRLQGGDLELELKKWDAQMGRIGTIEVIDHD